MISFIKRWFTKGSYLVTPLFKVFMSHNHLHYDFFGAKLATIFHVPQARQKHPKRRKHCSWPRWRWKRYQKIGQETFGIIHSPSKRFIQNSLSVASLWVIGHWIGLNAFLSLPEWSQAESQQETAQLSLARDLQAVLNHGKCATTPQAIEVLPILQLLVLVVDVFASELVLLLGKASVSLRLFPRFRLSLWLYSQCLSIRQS